MTERNHPTHPDDLPDGRTFPKEIVPGYRRDNWRINLGSGDDYRPDWLNVDLYATPRDWTVDLWSERWALPRRSFHVALMRDVLEHAPPRLHGKNGVVHVLQEAARILQDQATLRIQVPYAGSRDAWKNVDHYHHFVEDTFPHLLEVHRSDLPFRLRDQRLLRRVRFGNWFDSWYHLPKYLGIKPTRLGRKARLHVTMDRIPRPHSLVDP